ncbi:permease-like cell division protein FtsX [Mobilicoccus pelagius]|uniref:Cell division protein FtsX n=1 Tax=Mobilicoccus pelagius NBRC 104925 TaxID=1089455 RepID=H5URZ0_9MICO|nr:permease-like cell division protein FtsX [Mobilicoccus pelagius]GAB48498.1 cell division protein FtsX [Mobilicoccus pelagius NBRC 104925]
MIRPGFLLGEVWTGLRRSVSMALAVVIVTATSLFFLGVGLLADRQVSAAKGYWYDKVEVSIFLCPEKSNEPTCAKGPVTAQQRDAVKLMLDSMKPTVASVYYESQDEAYARFQEQFKDNPTFADTPESAIPAAFRVKLSDPAQYPLVEQTFSPMPGVAKVNDIREVLDPLIRVLDVLRTGALGVAGVMLVAAVLLTSTTIRQVAWSRRREVGIKRMVGASRGAIRAPFVLEILLASLVGAGVAVGALWAAVHVGVASFADRYADFAWVGVSDVWMIAGPLVIVAAVVSVVVSWTALSRHVRV